MGVDVFWFRRRAELRLAIVIADLVTGLLSLDR